jgi:hypothetical protein
MRPPTLHPALGASRTGRGYDHPTVEARHLAAPERSSTGLGASLGTRKNDVEDREPEVALAKVPPPSELRETQCPFSYLLGPGKTHGPLHESRRRAPRLHQSVPIPARVHPTCRHAAVAQARRKVGTGKAAARPTPRASPENLSYPALPELRHRRRCTGTVKDIPAYCA